ncbi:MAG TPA: hypothetical protein VM754_07680, partial [Actinomycetota bacterium]|nr:hypothetical protein [Actinomycetota bacterium]
PEEPGPAEPSAHAEPPSAHAEPPSASSIMTSVLRPVEAYRPDLPTEVEARIFRALDSLEDRMAHAQMSNLAAQSEDRILRALENLGNRLNQPPTTIIPDLVVLERIDQLQATVSNALGDMNRRLSDVYERGELELRLKNEVSEKLREVAVRLNNQLGDMNREIMAKMDAYQSETASRLDSLEAGMRRPDITSDPGLV